MYVMFYILCIFHGDLSRCSNLINIIFNFINVCNIQY